MWSTQVWHYWSGYQHKWLLLIWFHGAELSIDRSFIISSSFYWGENQTDPHPHKLFPSSNLGNFLVQIARIIRRPKRLVKRSHDSFSLQILQQVIVMPRQIAVTSKGLFEGVLVTRVGDGGVEIARRQPEKSFVHFLQFTASIQNQRKRPTQPNVL